MARRTNSPTDAPTTKTPSSESLLELLDGISAAADDAAADLIFLERERKKIPPELARRLQAVTLRAQSYFDGFATVGRELGAIAEELRLLVQPMAIGKGAAGPVELNDDD